MKPGRMYSICTIACHQCLSAVSLHRASIVCAILLVTVATCTCAFGFRPQTMSKGSARSLPGFAYNCGGFNVYSRHSYSSRIYASTDETLNGSNEMKPVGDGDTDDDEEEDIITQRLRRNSEAGPINPHEGAR